MLCTTNEWNNYSKSSKHDLHFFLLRLGYPIYMIKHFLEKQSTSDRKIHITYDIACLLAKHMKVHVPYALNSYIFTRVMLFNVLKVFKKNNCDSRLEIFLNFSKMCKCTFCVQGCTYSKRIGCQFFLFKHVRCTNLNQISQFMS